VNRAQPVNAYNWPVPEPGQTEALEEVFPNVVPTVPLET
jgi:DOPA 4,5-dioxygenase